jgi:hypothetical protein
VESLSLVSSKIRYELYDFDARLRTRELRPPQPPHQRFGITIRHHELACALESEGSVWRRNQNNL